MHVSRRVIEAPQEGRLCAEAPEEGKLCDILAYLGLIEFEDSAEASLALPFLVRALTIDPTHTLAEEAYREIVWQSVGGGAPVTSEAQHENCDAQHENAHVGRTPVTSEPIPASVSSHTVPADLSPASSAAGEETCDRGVGVIERGAMQEQEEKGSSRSAEPAVSLDSSGVPASVGDCGRKAGGAGRGARGLGAKGQTVLQDGYIHCGGRRYVLYACGCIC
ncbi:MAG: hypothetical protein ACPIOQ_36840 [Promethearchaeia archaeon]